MDGRRQLEYYRAFRDVWAFFKRHSTGVTDWDAAFEDAERVAGRHARLRKPVVALLMACLSALQDEGQL